MDKKHEGGGFCTNCLDQTRWFYDVVLEEQVWDEELLYYVHAGFTPVNGGTQGLCRECAALSYQFFCRSEWAGRRTRIIKSKE